MPSDAQVGPENVGRRSYAGVMAKRTSPGIPGIGLPVRRVEARSGIEGERRGWPYDIAAVRTLLTDGIDLGRATIVVGENGTGKSTLVEAIAEQFGLNPEGGSTGAMHHTRRTESSLAADLQLVRGVGGGRGGYFLRAETMHGFFTYLEESGMGSFHERSHGESFLDLIGDRFFDHRGIAHPGLYVLDEPESALSFSSSLKVLALLLEVLDAPGTQILMATHSPVLAALPGATIWEVSDAGLTPTAWEDLALVVDSKRFVAGPERVLHHLLSG